MAPKAQFEESGTITAPFEGLVTACAASRPVALGPSLFFEIIAKALAFRFEAGVNSIASVAARVRWSPSVWPGTPWFFHEPPLAISCTVARKPTRPSINGAPMEAWMSWLSRVPTMPEKLPSRRSGVDLVTTLTAPAKVWRPK
ncbi:hypothetical protein ACFSLT_21725 [Novosphingobium resinovorum]